MKNKLLFTGIILLVFGFLGMGCKDWSLDFSFGGGSDDHTYTVKYEVTAVFPSKSDDKIMLVRYSPNLAKYVEESLIRYGAAEAGEVEHQVKSPWEKTIKMKIEDQEGELFLYAVDDVYGTDLKVTIYVNGEEKVSESNKYRPVLVRYHP
jgi:hypothetical protein